MQQQFRCPLCGKYSVVEKYNPDEYTNEIPIVEFKGLGRGKGFKKNEIGDAIINEPDLSNSIARKALEIVKYMIEQELMDKDEVIDEIRYLI